MPRIDINCDLAEETSDEAIARDIALMQCVSSANLCGGAYAGNPQVLTRCTAAAIEQCVAIGAHPGYADPEHFGRRAVMLSPRALRELVWRQLDNVARCAAAHGGAMSYVKPHGALYHLVCHDPAWADEFASAVAAFDARLMIYALTGSELLASAARFGVVGVAEVFLDRNYMLVQERLALVPRDRADALIADPLIASARLLDILRTGQVQTIEGGSYPARAETACLHSDHPGSLDFARQVSARLVAEGVAIVPPVCAEA